MTENSKRFTTRARLALAGAVLLVAGGGVGAAINHATRPVAAMAPAVPVRIASLTSADKPLFGDPIVTVRGQIAEVYGNRFVLNDGSGRLLVDTGREGEHAGLFALGQTVTVQGHAHDGNLRAAFLVTPDGQVTALGPLDGPHGDRHGDRHGDGPRGGPHGPRDAGPDRPDGGPDAGPDGGPGDDGDRPAPRPAPPAAQAPAAAPAPAGK